MSSAEQDRSLVRGWLAAAADAGVRAELEDVYAQAAEAIAARGPACWSSGRCCNFEKTGHLLYVTGLEAAYTVLMARGATAPASERSGLPVLNNGGGDGGAGGGGACPFLDGHLCGVHAIKPLGCRVYFCDRSAQAWQQDLSERLLGEIRGIHDRRGLEYRYAEWRGMLKLMQSAE